jgi:hypothetical protein
MFCRGLLDYAPNKYCAGAKMLAGAAHVHLKARTAYTDGQEACNEHEQPYDEAEHENLHTQLSDDCSLTQAEL